MRFLDASSDIISRQSVFISSDAIRTFSKIHFVHGSIMFGCRTNRSGKHARIDCSTELELVCMNVENRRGADVLA